LISCIVANRALPGRVYDEEELNLTFDILEKLK